jgi:hypothetical protein
MLKPTFSRVILALIGGFGLILIASWSSGLTGEICNETKTGQEHCTPYNLAPFILIEIFKALDAASVAITALATVAIGYFTLTLKRSSDSLYVATKESADAANLSARAAINIELPILAAEVSDFHFSSVKEQGPTGILQDFQCCFANYLLLVNGGRTICRVTQIEGGWYFGADLPVAPVYTFIKHLILTAFLSPAVEEPMRVRISDYHLRIKTDAYDELRSAKSKLWLFCRVTYLDFMQDRHEVGFCWRRHEGVGGGFFVEDQTPAYNRKT